jgi:hypothetical protein
MKWQNQPQFSLYIQHWYCNVFSHLEKVEKRSGWKYSWTNDGINDISQKAIDAGFVQKNIANLDGTPKDGGDVLNYVGLFNLAAEYAGISDRAVSMHFSEHDYQPLPNEEEILELKRDGYAGSHFTAGNNVANQTPWNKEIEFDSIMGGSQCAKLGWIASKRILVF